MTPYLFLAPALVVLALVAGWPLLQALYLSFTRYDLLNPPQWVGLANYQQLAADPLFWQVLRQTLIYGCVAVPLLTITPLLLAIAIRRAKVWQVVYYVPVVVSIAIAGVAWKWVFAEQGLLNYGLSLLSGRLVQIPWLTDPRYALYAVITVTVWKGLGYYMVIYLAGLQAISPALYEAAALDGAVGWQQHWHITVPQMRPYMALVAILSAIASGKVFEEVYVMTRGGPLDSTKTLVYYLYEQGFRELNMGYAAAMGVVLLLVVLGLSLLAARVARRALG